MPLERGLHICLQKHCCAPPLARAANGAAAAGEVSMFELQLTAKDESGQPLPARDSATVKVGWGVQAGVGTLPCAWRPSCLRHAWN